MALTNDDILVVQSNDDGELYKLSIGQLKGDIDFSQYAELDNDQQSITAKEFIGDGSQLTGVVNKLTAGGGIALDPTDGQGTVEISSTVDTLTYKGTVDVTIQKPAAFTAAIAEIQDMYLNTGLGTFHSSWADVTDNADTSTEANPGDFMVYNQTSWDHIPAGSPPGTDGTWIDDGAGKLYPATTTNNVGIGTNSPGAKLDVRGDSLGSTAGDSVALGRFYNSTQTNSSQLFISSERVTDGSTWSTTSIRLQRFVDTQPQAYIDFTANRGTGTGQQDIAFGMGTIERMRITKQGNVGIGTTDPKSPLHVNGITRLEIVDPGTCLSMYADGKAYVYMGATDNKNFFINAGGETRIISFRTGGIDRVTIVDNGNVGIGTTEPKTMLDVAGTILTSNVNHGPNQDKAYLIAGTKTFSDETSSWGLYGFQHRLKSNSGGSARVTIDTNNGEAFCVTGNKNVGIGTTAPTALLEVNGIAEFTGENLAVYRNSGKTQGIQISGNSSENSITAVSTADNPKTFVIKSSADSKDIQIRTESDSPIYLSPGSTIRASFLPNGNVGIGTADPKEKLHVDDGDIVIGQSSGATTGNRNYLKFGRTSGTKAAIGFINSSGSGRGALLFMNTNDSTANEFTDDDERMRIDEDGNVGIGTTTPGYKLDVEGDLNATNYRIDQLPELV